jgi:hypothetical protein
MQPLHPLAELQGNVAGLVAVGIRMPQRPKGSILVQIGPQEKGRLAGTPKCSHSTHWLNCRVTLLGLLQSAFVCHIGPRAPVWCRLDLRRRVG